MIDEAPPLSHRSISTPDNNQHDIKKQQNETVATRKQIEAARKRNRAQ